MLDREQLSERGVELVPHHLLVDDMDPLEDGLVQLASDDVGSRYRSMLFAAALGEVTHKRTRPCRPQINGKFERYHRNTAFATWQHHYNHHRPHTALGGKPPITRVTNLPGHYN